MIPILDLKEQYQTVKAEIDQAIQAVLASGIFIMGPNVKALEEELALYLGVRHAVTLNSGTDALHLALRALDIGQGDEVITSPFTFAATTEAIGIVGATPVFVDIDPATFNLDPKRIQAAITDRTKAIMPVHLYGLPAAMDEIKAIGDRHGLSVVEDCAQAIGAEINDRKAGTIGDIGCFSFFPTKNLGAYGDGGMVTANDDRLASRLRALRVHGGLRKYYHEELGVNSRLDEIQAVVLRIKLRRLESWTDARRAAAKRYRDLFANELPIALPSEKPRYRHVYHQFTIRVHGRDAVQKHLAADGVQTMVYYPVPLHLQKVNEHLGYALGSFPEAEAAANEVLSLPMYPELRQEQQTTVCGSLSKALKDLAAA